MPVLPGPPSACVLRPHLFKLVLLEKLTGLLTLAVASLFHDSFHNIIMWPFNQEYERPETPELVLKTVSRSVKDCVQVPELE